MSFQQRAWDRPVIDASKGQLWNSLSDNRDVARLTSVSAPHSGDWLLALPITSCGLRLDDEALRVSVGLRLGANLCMAHTCPCGAEVDCSGIHGLSCRRACGCQSRHHAVNDIIWRAFGSAGIPASKEPSGLLRDDGKHPDGVSLIPWSQGRCVCWDVTFVDSLAASYLNRSASLQGGAAEFAAERKVEKYSKLPASVIFQPIAIECLGRSISRQLIFKRNAIAFALNAIVDVPPPPPPPSSRNDFCLNISETFRASNFKNYHNVALDSFYISTGNDVTSYFRSAANQTNVQMLGDILVAISR
jgi:hypothetical protein